VVGGLLRSAAFEISKPGGGNTWFGWFGSQINMGFLGNNVPTYDYSLVLVCVDSSVDMEFVDNEGRFEVCSFLFICLFA
jgi:hypothetical protein